MTRPLPIPTEEIAAALRAYQPEATAQDVANYRARMTAEYNAFITKQQLPDWQALEYIQEYYINELYQAAELAAEEAENWEYLQTLTLDDVLQLAPERVMGMCVSAGNFERLMEHLGLS